MLSLHQKLSQTQKLSPQQIQYQKLLQLNTLALEQRIKTELELNPVLEELEDFELEQEQAENNDDTDSTEDSKEDEYDNTDDEFDVEDYMNDVDIDNDRLNRSPDEDYSRPVAPARVTLSEYLMDQVRMLDLTDDQMIIAENIVGSVNRDGYFKEDLEKLVSELNLFEHLETTVDEAENVLKLIQTLDPIGVAARNLQECLLIQLKNISFDPYYSYLAEKILTDHYKEFVNKRFEIIQKNMDMNVETLKITLDLIHRLDPKPGEGNISSEEANQVTPDFLIEKMDNNYIITLNDRAVPSVTISKTYLEMINSKKRKRKISKRDKETHKFLREKFESAKWFIASIQQRRDTLMKIMRSILEHQYDFFEYGARALKPMIYKDIADDIEMDISTISRVVNGKYVESPQGIHELKYFFSEGLATDSGNEISNKHIKELIREIIENESKKHPYSDDKIAKILTGKGIHIARRTVAKYREQLMIPVARLRKEI
ncbi:MAG: RNA polymerase factor sigma-54 [Melioribacteraceae bacterium]|nr:RNA polymerase factor sigma-54 [Melioribacteraceae bacterium]MCF8355407.1 RNA polymerase factor sigma-54 [Melioribacteraceae bacterium]MCF8393249.1 RNA polymerase factor sigma-54 [Melioribacteraceae bacterium]MCF8417550.1 RNA polymerase factor sigma-54 [Melioribacteraceae bacterium]